MKIRIKDVAAPAGLYSYTRNIGNVQDRVEKGLNVLLCVGSICTVYWAPDYGTKATSFIMDEAQEQFFEECDEYDVFEIDEHHIVQSRYTRKDGDCTIYSSAQCNSNCVMCPISERQRKDEELEQTERLIELINYLNFPHGKCRCSLKTQ